MSEGAQKASPSPFEINLPMRASVLVVTAAIFLGLVYLFFETYNMMPPILPGYPGDAFFPRLVIGYSLIVATLILWRGLFLPHDAAAVGLEEATFSLHWLEFAAVIALVLVYALVLESVGFEAATVAFLMLLLVPRLRVEASTAQALLRGAALSVVTMLVFYVSFVLFLNIALPLRFLPRYIQ